MADIIARPISDDPSCVIRIEPGLRVDRERIAKTLHQAHYGLHSWESVVEGIPHRLADSIHAEVIYRQADAMITLLQGGSERAAASPLARQDIAEAPQAA